MGGVGVSVRPAALSKRLNRWVVEGIGGLALITLSSPVQAAPHPTSPAAGTSPKPLPSSGATVAGSPAIAPQPAPARPRGPVEAFGRWQPKISSCVRRLAATAPSLAAPAEACIAVLVDERSAGVFRVSWLDGVSSQGQARVLTFVGTLAPGGESMVCQEATCRLIKPFNVLLSSVSQGGFDRRGLPTGLPSAWLASGQCQLERARIRCEAKARSGEIWTAQAQLL
jgi:hypothetical protein